MLPCRNLGNLTEGEEASSPRSSLGGRETSRQTGEVREGGGTTAREIGPPGLVVVQGLRVRASDWGTGVHMGKTRPGMSCFVM